jgi:hypothetical protein
MEKKKGLRCRFTKQWIVMCNAELEDVVLLKLSGFGVSVLLFCIFYHAYRCVTEKKRGLQCRFTKWWLVMCNVEPFC